MSLEDIRTREQAATEGPWKFDDEGWLESENRDVHEYIVTPESYPPEPMERVVRLIVGREPDAEFIAHARTDIPKLLAALDAVEARLAGWQERFDGDEAQDTAVQGIVHVLRTTITEALG